MLWTAGWEFYFIRDMVELKCVFHLSQRQPNTRKENKWKREMQTTYTQTETDQWTSICFKTLKCKLNWNKYLLSKLENIFWKTVFILRKDVLRYLSSAGRINWYNLSQRWVWQCISKVLYIFSSSLFSKQYSITTT